MKKRIRSHLGRFVNEAREAKGYSRKHTVELLGYSNEVKGLRKLDKLELDGRCNPGFW